MKNALIFLSLWVYVFTLLNAPPSHAHHGKDFLIVETSELPPKGESYLITSFKAISDEQEMTGAFLHSLTDVFAAELHAHFEKEKGKLSDFQFASFAPELRLKLDNLHRLLTGSSLSMEYEFAKRHVEDTWESRVSFSNYFRTFHFAANLFFEKQPHEEINYGYALGIKHSLKNFLAVGLEVENTLSPLSGSLISPTIYYDNGKNLNFKLGVLASDRDDETTNGVLLSFVYGF